MREFSFVSFFCFHRALRYFRVQSCSADMSVMYTLLADMHTCSLCSTCLVIVGDGCDDFDELGFVSSSFEGSLG